MSAKNNEAANLILKREPRAAEQVNIKYFHRPNFLFFIFISLIIKVEIFFILPYKMVILKVFYFY
jgi:hypothetical protein